MDRNKRNFFKKHPSNQFKRKGVNKNGSWNNPLISEHSFGNSQPIDTVYRILCPSRKIGGVIGKGGNIVKALREETQAKITVADSVSGSDERVILIYSSPTKISRKQSSNKDSNPENEEELVEPHCAAQDALLKVHDRIVMEDHFGGMASDDDNEKTVVMVRLLVPNNMVGCLLGKHGDVIQKLRSETGANIRVLPAEHLPACAVSTDELVQISGKPDVVKRALYEVSTRLHQNPRKDKPPLNFSKPYGAQSFHPPVTNKLPPANPVWSHRNSSSHGMPLVPLMGAYRDHPSGVGPGGFDAFPSGHGGETSAEFSMKILCSAAKIGGVIGKGGCNVKQLQQETGASIHVEDASTDSNERVIRVSALEALWNSRSQTIEAILQLQIKASELLDKDAIITRLLVPSSKVGCLLGQGGNVINEMRRRTQADIRVCSKDDKLKFASVDEELVQISGNFVVAKEALAEIASRLRMRTLRDANTGSESNPVRSVHGFGSIGSLPAKEPPPSGPMQGGNSGGYEHLWGGGHEFEPQSYHVPPAATGYLNMNSGLEAKIPSNMGAGGTKNPSISEAFMASAGQNMSGQLGSHQKLNAPQSSYRNMNLRQSPFHAPKSLYQNVNPQQSTYHNNSSLQSPYVMATQQGPSANISTQQSAYYNISAQQGAYQY